MGELFDALMQQPQEPVPADNGPTNPRALAPTFEPESIVSRALDRGTAGLKMTGGAALDFLGQKLGVDTLSDWGKDIVARSMAEAALNPAEVQSWEDADGLAEHGKYILEKTVENLPNMASMLVGGGLGGAGARLLAAGAAKKALQVAGKEAARRLITDRVKKGALLGAAGAVYPQHVGEMWQELDQAGVDADKTVAPFFTAAINTALDVGPFERLLSFSLRGLEPDLAKDLVKQAAKTYAEKGALRGTGRVFGQLARQGGKGAALGALVEGPTEALQEIVNLQGRALNDPEFDPFSPEAMSRVRDAFIAGAAVGGALGGAGRVGGVGLGMAGEALGSPQGEQNNDQQGKGESTSRSNRPSSSPVVDITSDKFQDPAYTPGARPAEPSPLESAAPAPETDESLAAQVDTLARGDGPGGSTPEARGASAVPEGSEQERQNATGLPESPGQSTESRATSNEAAGTKEPPPLAELPTAPDLGFTAPAPETEESLTAQVDALARGKKPGVLISETQGSSAAQERLETGRRAAGLLKLRIAGLGTLYVRPEHRAMFNALHQALRQYNKPMADKLIGRLVGIPEVAAGAPIESDQKVVQTRDEQGRVITQARAPEGKEAETAAAAAETAPENGQVEVVTPEEAMTANRVVPQSNVRREDRITREMVQAEPDTLFLFGDNELRRGTGGQAAYGRGMKNAVGVRTKKAPHRGRAAYWSDDQYERNIRMIDEDLTPVFEHVRRGGKVVIPTDGLGTGLAELPERAPRTFDYLQQRLQELEQLAANRTIDAPTTDQSPQPVMDRAPVDLAKSRKKSPKFFAKDKAKADRANKFIGRGSPGSSTEAYREAAEQQGKANVGEYSPEDTVFVSAEGVRRDRVPIHKKDDDGWSIADEIRKAAEAGATIITDNPENRGRRYNVGEREVATLLHQLGYTETTDGEMSIWRPADKASPEQTTEPDFVGGMTFAYGTNARPGLTSETTFDAILRGERTATTRRVGKGWGYWVDTKTGEPKVKPGHIIRWKSGDGRTVDVRVTKVEKIPRGKARDSYDWEAWSQREGWTPEFGRKYVGDRAAIQIQFEPIDQSEPSTETSPRETTQSTEQDRAPSDTVPETPPEEQATSSNDNSAETTETDRGSKADVLDAERPPEDELKQQEGVVVYESNAPHPVSFSISLPGAKLSTTQNAARAARRVLEALGLDNLVSHLVQVRAAGNVGVDAVLQPLVATSRDPEITGAAVKALAKAAAIGEYKSDGRVEAKAPTGQRVFFNIMELTRFGLSRIGETVNAAPDVLGRGLHEAYAWLMSRGWQVESPRPDDVISKRKDGRVVTYAQATKSKRTTEGPDLEQLSKTELGKERASARAEVEAARAELQEAMRRAAHSGYTNRDELYEAQQAFRNAQRRLEQIENEVERRRLEVNRDIAHIQRASGVRPYITKGPDVVEQTLQEIRLTSKIAELQDRLRSAEQRGDTEQVDAITAELDKAVRQLEQNSIDQPRLIHTVEEVPIARPDRPDHTSLEPVSGDVSGTDNPESTDTRNLESANDQRDRASLETGDLASHEPPLLAPGVGKPNHSAPAPEAEVVVVEGSTDEALSAEAEVSARLLNEVGVRTAVQMADVDGLQALAQQLVEHGVALKNWMEQRAAAVEAIRRKRAKNRGEREQKLLEVYDEAAQRLERARRNLINIRAVLNDSTIRARTIFLELGMDARGRRITTPVIFLRQGAFKAKYARAEALVHELGHIVLRDSMTSAPDEVLGALHEVLGGQDFTEFEENFANAFLLWAKQKALDSLDERPDPTSERIRELVKRFFRGLWQKLRKLWREGQRNFGVDQRFSDFMEGLVNRQRLRLDERPVSGTSEYVRYGESIGSGIALHTQPYAAEYLDFTMPYPVQERARKIKRFWKPRIESAAHVMHTLHDRAFRGYNAWLRHHGMKWLADEFLPRAGERRGRSDPGVFRRIRGEGAQFWTRLTDMAKDFGPEYRLRDMLRGKDPELSEEYRNLQEVLLRGSEPMNTRVARQVRQIRRYLEDLRIWLDSHYVRFRKHLDYFPVLWSRTKLRRLGVERFVDTVVAWARENPADAIVFFLSNNLSGELDSLLDADLVGLRQGTATLTEEQWALIEARARTVGASMYDALSDPQSVMAEGMDGDFEFVSPAFMFAHRRKLPATLVEALRDYREDDIFEVLASYTHAAVKRGVWQDRFGANDIISEIDQAFRTMDSQDAARLREQYREDMRKRYGIDLYDPAAKIIMRLKDQFDRGEITEDELAFVRDKVIPAYQGRLGQDMHPIWRRFQGAAIIYQNLRTLSLGVFSQMVDFGLVLHQARGKRWQAMVDALRMAFDARTRKEWLSFARELGMIQDDITDHVLNDYEGSMLLDAKLRRINEKFFKLNGMHYLTNFTRAWATRIATSLILEAARRGDDAFLSEYGTDSEAVLRWERDGKPMMWYDQNEKHASVFGALHQFVDQGVLRTTPASRPTWGNDQRYAIFWHLKSFSWEFTYSVLDRVWQDSVRRWGETEGARRAVAAVPFITLAGITMLFAALGMEARWLISPPKKRPDDLWSYLWAAFERGGAAGMAQTLFDMDTAASYHRFALIAAGGPTVGQLEEVISKGLDYNLIRALPAYPIAGRLADILE